MMYSEINVVMLEVCLTLFGIMALIATMVMLHSR
jgi:hypothetical protein